MWSRAELKERALNVLRAHRWAAVAVCFIWSIASGGSGGFSSSYNNGGGNSNSNPFISTNNTQMEVDWSNPVVKAAFITAIIVGIIGIVFALFVTGPLEVGVQKFFISAREDDADMKHLGFGFTNNYLGNVGKIFLRSLYIFLWSLLFCIPGIIKAYEYRMVPYILADNPDLTSKQAFGLSKKMMDGEKWNTFILDLSFIPWYLLSIPTCMILAMFHVMPYQLCTNAELYDVLREKVVSSDVEAAQLLGYQKEEVI